MDDEAPTGDNIAAYDEQHYVTYLRLLDVDAEGAKWAEAARVVLHRDPASDVVRTRRCQESDLARAKWMTKTGSADTEKGRRRPARRPA